MSAARTYESLRGNAKILLHSLEELIRDLEGDLLPRIEGTLRALTLESRQMLNKKVTIMKVETKEHGCIVVDETLENAEQNGGEPEEDQQGAKDLSPKTAVHESSDPLRQKRKRTFNDSGRKSSTFPNQEPSQESCTNSSWHQDKSVAENKENERPEATAESRNDTGIPAEYFGSKFSGVSPTVVESFPVASQPSYVGLKPSSIADAGKEAKKPELRSADDITDSCSPSKKRCHSFTDADMAPRKRARTDNEQETLTLPRSVNEEAELRAEARVKEEALQASAAAQMWVESLEQNHRMISDLQLDASTILEELRGQRWLLWYRLCCCTVVSSTKYSFRGGVRTREAKRKYDELRNAIAGTEMLHDVCADMMEHARNCLFGRQPRSGRREFRPMC